MRSSACRWMRYRREGTSYGGRGRVPLRRAGLHAYNSRAFRRVSGNSSASGSTGEWRGPVTCLRATPARPPRRPEEIHPGPLRRERAGQKRQLAALAREAAAGEGFVAWVRSTDDAADDLQASADEVLKKGLGRTQGMDFGSMALMRAQVVSNAPQPWVTVCIDGVELCPSAAVVGRGMGGMGGAPGHHRPGGVGGFAARRIRGAREIVRRCRISRCRNCRCAPRQART